MAPFRTGGGTVPETGCRAQGARRTDGAQRPVLSTRASAMAMEASLPGPSRRRSKTSSGKRPLAINAFFKSGWFELYMWSSVSVSESAAWASLFLEPCLSIRSSPGWPDRIGGGKLQQSTVRKFESVVGRWVAERASDCLGGGVVGDATTDQQKSISGGENSS